MSGLGHRVHTLCHRRVAGPKPVRESELKRLRKRHSGLGQPHAELTPPQGLHAERAPKTSSRFRDMVTAYRQRPLAPGLPGRRLRAA
jgi:hypothetical protein